MNIAYWNPARARTDKIEFGVRVGADEIAAITFVAHARRTDLAGRVKPENKIAIAALASRIAFLGGGVPIIRDGIVIGAIGTSGGSEDQDVESAEFCLAAFDGGPDADADLPPIATHGKRS